MCCCNSSKRFTVLDLWMTMLELIWKKWTIWRLSMFIIITPNMFECQISRNLYWAATVLVRWCIVSSSYFVINVILCLFLVLCCLSCDVSYGYWCVCVCTGWANKKCDTFLLSISLPIIDRFSKFFHWHTLQTVCSNVIIIIFPTTP